MEKPLTVIELPAITFAKRGSIPKIELKNIKIRLSGGTIDVGITPRLLLNFEVIEYEAAIKS